MGRWLARYALLSGLLIGVALVLGAWASSGVMHIPSLHFLLDQDAIGNLTFYNGLALLVLGGLALLPGALGSTIDRIALGLMLGGLVLSAVSAFVAVNIRPGGALTRVLQVTRFQSIILLVIGVVFYFSRFRAADVFAKWALRILLIGGLAMAVALVLFGPLSVLARPTAFPRAAGILSTAAVLSVAFLLYHRGGSLIDVFVERRIFGKRDPRLLLQGFQQQLGSLVSKPDVVSATRSISAQALAMKPEEIRAESSSASSTAEKQGHSIPILTGQNPLQLVVSLTGNRKVLLTTEINLLHEVALYAARRLDDLEHEEERIERIRLQSRLSQQLVEAELRALRAQINPHFLFNSLNTIASLIPSEPDKAERITVRLGSMFRYVLTHADRPLTSLGEELEFLQTFLDIEQIRFGDRLIVEFDVEAPMKFTPIPSLILQPLVENAIKHGVAPKVGKSRISVRAKRESKAIRVEIEDDGVGLQPIHDLDRRSLTGGLAPTGIGLKNIRERLDAMYGGSADLSLEDLAGGGCRASLKIPIDGAKDAHSSAIG
jgi:two-component system LytT family sensor kinase